MNNRHLKRAAAAFSLAAALVFCLSASEASRLRTSPASATTAVDGAALYVAKCASCHGRDGRGLPAWKAKGQPDLTDATFQKSHNDQQLTASIKDGKGRLMPPFKAKLSDEEIRAVVARVRAFGKKS